MRRVKPGRIAGPIALAAVLGAGVAYAVTSQVGVIGPSNRIQPSGRRLEPAGKLTPLGNLPTGGALTTNGRFLWALSTGRGRNDVRIVRVATPSCKKEKARKGGAAEARKERSRCKRGKRRGPRVGTVVQTIPFPGLTGGVAMSPDGLTAYVSGVADSSHQAEQVDPSVPGREGDVIHVLHYDPKTGLATRTGLIGVPPPSDAPVAQDFPTSTDHRSWPRDIAVSPNGRTLLVALNLADAAALIDTATGNVRYVNVGHYPYGAGITTDGRFGLVSSETQGTVAVIDLAAGEVVKSIQVAPPLSHAESIAVDPRAPLAFVGNANQDTITVIDTKSLSVTRTLSVERPQGVGTSPTDLSVTSDGCDLLSADSGEDAVAVFALSKGKRCGQGPKVSGERKQGGKKGAAAVAEPAAKRKGKHKKSHRRKAKPFQLVGRIPTGSYPTMAAATPKRRQLVWVSARGLGVGPNPGGPNPNTGDDSYLNQYLPSIVDGASGVLSYPSDRKIRRLTPVSDRQVVPSDARTAPADTPIRGGGPIKHVFYIVRENRTYDQVLGDDSRGDGDPALTLFGSSITPNMHALVQRFPLLDHVYANSEASIDGHYWTAAGAVSDYVIKNWHQNYAGRNRPYDFGSYEVSAPPKGYIFQRMLESGVSFYNYGEALAGISPFPDKDRTPEQTAENAQVLDSARTDVQLNGGCYDSDISIFDTPAIGPKLGNVYDSSLPPGSQPGDASRFTCFNTRFQAQLATNSVPTFNYLSLPLNHTEGLAPGKRTPDADIADNDWALGQIVEAISHSSIWNSSLILVVEDDSQNGADHVDAHRIPALVISPYTQRGAVVHDRYDQLSFLRTLEIISGLPSLNLGEALAVPLYGAVTPNAGNSAPYDAIMPSVDMTAVNPATAANIAASRGQPLDATDQVPQRVLDGMLWHYRHGFGSQPPPPGPNASTLESKRVDDEAIDVEQLAREIRRLSGRPYQKQSLRDVGEG
ncbi:MAG TPA: alkaline phosphatase family protein [Solirubrobacterales bacterium]|nr:alkaline phosphatase family protein [Solirubrobacterales bacterium]